MILTLLSGIDYSWYITVLIALVTYLFVSLWVQRRGLPPGPTPLPILGNILSLMRKDIRTDELIGQWRKRHGDIITMWPGPKPIVVVCGWDAIKDGLVVQRNAFSGKVIRFTGQLVLDGYHDVLLGDYTPVWETLRKLLQSAVRKYAASEKLPVLVDDVVEQAISAMLKQNEPVDFNFYLYLTLYNILASTAFGKRYEMNDPEFLTLKTTNDTMNDEFGIGLPTDFFPFLRYLFYHKERRMMKLFSVFKGFINDKFLEHKTSYVSGTVRDFTDAVLAAKEEAEKEDSETAAHLVDGNLTLILFDFFSAGTDTTRITLMWIFLYICNHPEVQEKMRQEVTEVIGDRMAVQEDRNKCNYITAVITEVLRIRPIISFTFEHKATDNVQLGGYQIPKGTGVIFHILSQHMDENVWPEPEVFRPERFLDEDGKFTSARLPGYLPFGLGRRGCPGEKLAQADLFLIVTGMLQKCRFSLPDGPGTADLVPQNVVFVNIPKDFKLKVEKL